MYSDGSVEYKVIILGDVVGYYSFLHYADDYEPKSAVDVFLGSPAVLFNLRQEIIGADYRTATSAGKKERKKKIIKPTFSRSYTLFVNVNHITY